jgi:hypothetical protein
VTELTLAADASPTEIATLRARLVRLAGGVASGPTPRAPVEPFLVATPLGLDRREALEQGLSVAGVEIGVRTPLAFPAAATALYVSPDDDDEALHRAAAFERLWQWRWEGRAGERWSLASVESFPRLLSAKRALRAEFTSLSVRVATPRRAWIARLHAFHVPDADRVEVEGRLLLSFVHGQGGEAPRHPR